MKLNKGFTLIELLVVIGIIGILAAIVVIAVNPGQQFALARNTQRRAHLNSIGSAIYQFGARHDGDLPGTDDSVATSNFPTTATCIGTTAPCFNLAAAGEVDGLDDGVDDTIVPNYVAEIPIDPQTGGPADVGYLVHIDPTTSRIVLSAPDAELSETISITY